MEPNMRRDSNSGRKESKSSKDDKGTKMHTKTTGTKFKERWLLTRKTWRYMSDAGKKLFPDGANPNKKEDIAKLEAHFQELSDKCSEYVLWDPNKKIEPVPDTEEEKCISEREDQPNSVPPVSSCDGRERLNSTGELGWGLPAEIYNQLLRSFGASTLHRVASRLLEEQFMEEDEFDYDEDGELVEIDGRTMRSIGSQTDPYLDMCVQTDHDANAEDLVGVGAETRQETEAAVAHDRALMQEKIARGEIVVKPKTVSPLYQHQMQTKPPEHTLIDGSQPTVRHQISLQAQENQAVQQPIQQSNTQQPHHPQDAPATQQQQTQTQPPVLKKFWARRESLTAKTDNQPHQPEKTGRIVLPPEKEKEVSSPKGKVAAKLASLEASTPPGASVASIAPNQPKPQEKKKQNVFKLGLKCDVEGQQSVNKTAVEKAAMDKFKTVNYDKTLRNIKSKWVPTAEEDAYIKALERDNEFERERGKETKLKEKERFKMRERDERLQEKEKEKAKDKAKEKEKEKKKRKARSIQVGDPLPQFILNSFRINSPVEIIHATRRRLRRFSSKPESVSGSESSMPPSGMISPRFSICVLDDQGNRELVVSEAEAYKLSQMGIPFVYKRSGLESSLDNIDLEKDPTQGTGTAPPHTFQRSLSAVQASGHLTQLLYNLRSGRLAHSLGGGSGGYFGSRASDRAQRLTQSLLQYLLPTVMQRSRGSGGGHSSRLVAQRIWRTRSKSQSRASAGTTSIWTPMGNSTWMSVTGRLSTLEPTSLLHFTELERFSLQRISCAKLQALNLGCQIKLPKESTNPTPSKKRGRPYLLKRKALSTGFFETKKEESKGTTGGLVFGLSLIKCLENERLRSREAVEREAIALALAGTPSGEEGDGSLSRKSSQAGSNASFTSLLDGVKHSTTGSLESLNLERKRPSLGGSDVIVGGSPTSLDLLTVDLQPQVPDLVSNCCRFLEEHGLHTLGIFRVSSSKKRVRQLREEFDSGKEVVLTEENCPHDVATLLKEFFRDLPEPLLTRELYEAFLCTQTEIRNRRLQFEALQYLVQLLPLANRDTLYTILNFLTTVAEHATADTESELVQGNKMDSSNLATLFAPNILHQLKPGSEALSTSQMTAQAEERIDVINVVRTMIDHNKELFEVSPELLDETYQHLMDSHPEALDVLLRRRCTGPDELDLEIDTSSSVFEGSETSSPLPCSPTDQHDFEKLRAGIGMEDSEGLKREPPSMQEIPIERTRRRRRHEEEEMRSHYREKRSSSDGNTVEERSWFRRREKSGSRELERGLEQAPERTRWFRRREKTSSKTPDHKIMSRQGSDKTKEKTTVRQEVMRISSQESLESQSDRKARIVSEQEKLRVPDPPPNVRRLSSPEIDAFGVITASLKIPVPLQQLPSSLAFTQETDIPYIEENSLSEEAKLRLKESDTTVSTSSRQRTGSNDSFLGQPITGTMSFQPLTTRDNNKQSHDSVLSSSSVGIFTMSPSERNTPSSDFHYASGASSPLSGAISPPMWLSPDSGTPGLSPPNSPPPQRRRSRRKEESSPKPTPLTHSATHTFGSKPSAPPRTREKTHVKVFPISRARTSDTIKLEETVEISRSTATMIATRECVTRTRTSEVVSSEAEKDANKKYTRRRYTAERHHTGNLTDLSSNSGRPTPAENSTQLWKRWEIIASDPTEPETFV